MSVPFTINWEAVLISGRSFGLALSTSAVFYAACKGNPHSFGYALSMFAFVYFLDRRNDIYENLLHGTVWHV